MSLLGNAPNDAAIVNLDEVNAKTPSVRKGCPQLPWAMWFSQVAVIILGLTGSGPTSQRPTKVLWVGRPYLDTTLGKPIWLLSVGPIVWIDATGAHV